tara:strand:+ start:376 stop:672 length:297 start_codon:yes stop_codon:yes gene_type:complete
MTWQNDPVVMLALDEFFSNQQTDLNHLMQTLNDYMDETPIWGMIVLYGKLVMYYNELRQDATENEAFREAIARLGNDELTQALVANILGTVMNRKVGL